VEGDDARILLDLRDCGDIELEAVLRDGTPYIDDNFQLRFVSIGTPQLQFCAGFQVPPHVVTAVLPGRYRVSLDGGGWLLTDGAPVRANLPPFEIDVQAGTTTRRRIVFEE
jgi:hypothetical protein